jgi:hypothetical protein
LLLQAAQSNKSLYLDLLSVAHLVAPDSKIFTSTAVVPGILREYNIVEGKSFKWNSMVTNRPLAGGILNDFFSWCGNRLNKFLTRFGATPANGGP